MWLWVAAAKGSSCGSILVFVESDRTGPYSGEPFLLDASFCKNLPEA